MLALGLGFMLGIVKFVKFCMTYLNLAESELIPGLLDSIRFIFGMVRKLSFSFMKAFFAAHRRETISEGAQAIEGQVWRQRRLCTWGPISFIPGLLMADYIRFILSSV